MLCSQSRQCRSQGFYSVTLLLFSVCVFLVSCFEGNRELSEAERSAFGNYVNELDSSLTGSWFTRMGVSSDADSLLSYLRKELPRNGLDTTAFFIPQIASDLDIVHRLAFDSVGVCINELLPRLDHNLTEAYVTYITGQRYGFVRPDRLLNRMDIKVNSSEYARLFDYEIQAPDDDEAKEKLALSDRLSYLISSTPTSPVYKALQDSILKTTDSIERRKLAINMERCRWQIKHPDAKGRMVLVNIPAQQLWAVGGDSALSMKICCGAVLTKTPLLCSEISYLQVNPEWNIPYNIVKSDVVRHAGDSSYFARNRYFIIDRKTGDTIHAKKVTSAQLANGSVRVSQRSGVGNSLGRIVFRFPNNFSVYLHDTNNHGAFARERRTLSHGCVRVQKPFELACFLLPNLSEWEKDQLRISMDIRPETEQGKDYLKSHEDAPRPFRLITYREVSPHVPVFIVYFTAYPNPSTGVVETWPDLYGYDKAIGREMDPFLP